MPVGLAGRTAARIRLTESLPRREPSFEVAEALLEPFEPLLEAVEVLRSSHVDIHVGHHADLLANATLEVSHRDLPALRLLDDDGQAAHGAVAGDLELQGLAPFLAPDGGGEVAGESDPFALGRRDDVADL